MALRIFLLRTINMTKLQETCNIHIHKMGYFPHCSPNCGVYPSASIKFEVKVCTYLSNACLHVTWWVGKNHSFRPTQDPMSYSGFVHFNDTFTFPSEWCTYVPTLHTHCARPKSTESFLGHTCTPNAQNVVPHAFQRLCPWNEAWRKTIKFFPFMTVCRIWNSREHGFRFGCSVYPYVMYNAGVVGRTLVGDGQTGWVRKVPNPCFSHVVGGEDHLLPL